MEEHPEKQITFADLTVSAEAVEDFEDKLQRTGIASRLEQVVVEQSAEILRLQQELQLYETLYGKIESETIENYLSESEKPDPLVHVREIHKAQSIDVVQRSNRSKTKFSEVKVSESNPEIDPTDTKESEKLNEVKSDEVLPVSEEPVTPSQITMKLSKNQILKHAWVQPKKSSVLFGSPKIITVNNFSAAEVYVTIYDRVRMGVSRKHSRVSPVFVIGGKPLLFEKPPLRSSRSLHLLVCKDASLFPESETEMPDIKFRTFPQICVDFSNDIVIEADKRGTLHPMTKVQWEKHVCMQTQNPPITSSEKNITQKSEEILPSQVVTVRYSSSLCQRELDFIKHRSAHVYSGLEKYLDMSLDGKYLPRIAFCGSGGGCRSMVSTLGFLIGMDAVGLLPCITYIAGVSGSTWTLALWIALGMSPDLLRENIADKFAQNLISRPNSKGASELFTLLKQKWYPGSWNLSFVDIYGAQLAAGLLCDTTPAGCEYKLSHQARRVLPGDFPMPIYTAVQRQTDNHHNWFEFTPFEIGCSEEPAFVPTSGFGRKYQGGKSVDLHPEPSLGLLLGMFGSAFCAPIERVAEELFDVPDDILHEKARVTTEPGFMKKTVLDYKETVEKVIDRMNLHHTSVLAAAKFNNFAYDPSAEATRKCEQTLELYDAGIDGNLPIPVLLRPERKIDIIIATNSSKYPDINRGRALREAQEWATRNNMKFPPVDYANSYATHISVYKDPNDIECPVVIYLPLKKNNTYDPDFDPQQIQREGGYTSTFNFNMKKEQVQQLSGLSEHNMTISSPVIAETIKQLIEAKTEYYSKKAE